jgi:D-tyrosyl-tRNA(Tyr) deacylase
MRVVVQRVTEASVKINNSLKGKIEKGLLLLIGIEHSDTEEDVEWLASKIVRLRIFDDDNGVMNLDRKSVV